MKNLIIIGAGGFGREVYGWAQQSKDCGAAWNIKGFIDNNLNALDGYDYGTGIVATVDDYEPAQDDVFICTIGQPAQKIKCCETILSKDGKFINIIHPSVIIGNNAKLGSGVIMCPHVVLTSDVTIGDFVALNLHAAVGHDAVIGDYCQINSFCDITGNAKLGHSVLMGSHAAILPGVEIGKHAVVGAGSVVSNKVSPHTTVFGVPATPLRNVH